METQPESGAPVEPKTVSKDSQGDSPEPITEPKDEPKVVSWKDHQRLMDDMHKFKKRAMDAETKNGEIESTRLREKEDWKGLAEKSQKELEAEKSKSEKLSARMIHDKRFDEVRAVAVQAGIRKEAIDDLELLNLSEIEVELTSSNRLLVHGAEGYVKTLRQQKPHWFSKDKTPNVNAGGGGAAPDKATGKLLATDIWEAERAMKAGRITPKKYKEMFNQYINQKK